jgi:endoglucanase
MFAGTAAIGGGPYDDKNVSDEMYWAAAELYTTTKKDVYKDFLTKSPHFKSVPIASADEGLPSPMSWGQTEALGTITLAVVPNKLPKEEIRAARKNIEAAADAYVDLIKGQGYRVPFKPGSKGFPWGSNSFVLNNMMVMALAYDFTKDAKYLEGVNEGMNYLLGRNPRARRRARSRADPTRDSRTPMCRPPGWPAAHPRSAGSTTSRPGRPTRSPSTGTRPWPGRPPSSTRRARRPRRPAPPPASGSGNSRRRNSEPGHVSIRAKPLPR